MPMPDARCAAILTAATYPIGTTTTSSAALNAILRNPALVMRSAVRAIARSPARLNIELPHAVFRPAWEMQGRDKREHKWSERQEQEEALDPFVDPGRGLLRHV